MNGVLDGFLVGLVLVLSAGYAVMALGPRSLRRRILAAFGRLLAHAPGFWRLRRLSQRLEAASAGPAQGACGGCDSCGSEPAPPTQLSRPAEVRVPLGEIGRRGNLGGPR
jgi:hypothetical protein